MLIKENSKEFEQPSLGSHVARCVKLIDIGTQQSEYQGSVSIKRQLIIGWELGHELMTEGEYAGKPFGVSKFYTASLSEKANLRKDLIGWRGRDFTKEELDGFDIRKVLGTACMVSLIAKQESTRVKVGGVMALPKGMQVPGQINPTVYLSLERDEFDQKTFDGLSDKMKEIIRKSPEFATLQGKSSSVGDMEDSDLETPPAYLDDDSLVPF